jgi:hypothetical protein
MVATTVSHGYSPSMTLHCTLPVSNKLNGLERAPADGRFGGTESFWKEGTTWKFLCRLSEPTCLLSLRRSSLNCQHHVIVVLRGCSGHD